MLRYQKITAIAQLGFTMSRNPEEKTPFAEMRVGTFMAPRCFSRPSPFIGLVVVAPHHLGCRRQGACY